MPAKSAKQQRFMAAVANNPKFAKKVGVPKSVGEEFMKMKKGYKAGGKLPMVKGPDGKMIPEYAADGKGKMKKGGKVKKYQMGGMTQMRQAPQDESIMKGRRRRTPSMPDAPMAPPRPPAPPTKGKKKRPSPGPGMPQMPTMKSGGKVKKMKSGGKVRGCGMAKQGVRSAKMVTMKGS